MMEALADGLRIFNLCSAIVLLAITAVAVVWRWRRMDPVERLFSLALTFILIYTMLTTMYGLRSDIPFRWYLLVLAIANVWLIVTVILLTLRPDPEFIPPTPREEEHL